MTVPFQKTINGFFNALRFKRGALTLFFAALLLSFSFAAPAQAQYFDDDGNSGSVWIKMFRGNSSTPTCDEHATRGSCLGKDQKRTFFGWGQQNDAYGIAGWIADPSASSSFANALRYALGIYSNALLIVASVILLYHLLIMVTETAHQGVVGGKRANQIWAPIRLVIAIGLLVPLAGGLNSAQYIMLQTVEWGSNMATKVWDQFLAMSGQGSGSDPTADPPDTGSLAREAAKIGACMALINNYIDNTKDSSQKERIAPRMKPSAMTGGGMAILYGNEKYESLCGSIIIYAGGMGAGAGMGGMEQIMEQMKEPAKHFLEGNKEYNQDPGQAPAMTLSFALGTLESVSGGWNNAGGSSGAGWVSAGSWFLALAAGGSNRVSGTDTLPIVMGPQAEKIRPEKVQQAFFGMAEWIVGKYKSNMSGGVADPDTLGNTVAGRKFVDLLMLFIDQVGVVSGCWAPGSIAFYINLGNSPLAELVDLGHRMIRTALDSIGYAVELGVNEPQHAAYSSQYKASDGSKSFGPKSGLFFATMAIPILSATAMMLLTTGITLGIFMPLLPFTKFVLSVLTWVLSVLEALACVPLLALAWLTPYGEGFAGQKVEPGYWLIIHAFLRPVMTVFGLVASMLLFNIAAYLVTEFYQAIASNVGTFKGGMYVIAKLAFGQMYVSILYLCLNASLKAMDTLGRHATTWMGGRSHEENMGDGQAAVSMAQQAMGQFSSGLQSMAYASQGAGQMLANAMGDHGGGGKGGGAVDSRPPEQRIAPGPNQPGAGGAPGGMSSPNGGGGHGGGGAGSFLTNMKGATGSSGGTGNGAGAGAVTGSSGGNIKASLSSVQTQAGVAGDKAHQAHVTAQTALERGGPAGPTGPAGAGGNNFFTPQDPRFRS